MILRRTYQGHVSYWRGYFGSDAWGPREQAARRTTAQLEQAVSDYRFNDNGPPLGDEWGKYEVVNEQETQEGRLF